MRCLWIVVALAGCGAHSSRIGPYLTNVERQGSELALVVCDILIDDGTLQMGQCTTQRVPLAGLTPVPPGAAGAPPGSNGAEEMPPGMAPSPHR